MSRNRKVKNNIYIPNQELYNKGNMFTDMNAFNNYANFQKKQQQLKNLKRK